MRRLAYLFPTFPVLHQTFTVGEVLGLKERGYDLRLIALKRSGGGRQQPGAEHLVAETEYCPRLLSPSLVGLVLRAALTHPRRFLGLVTLVYAAWRDTPVVTRDSSDDPGTTMGWREKLRGIYHCNSLVYLLKSLSTIPYALYVSSVLERDGVEHVHAHWASYPATVAYLVKAWSGIPYSFTAHAYDIHMVQRMLPAKLDEASFVVTCAETNRRFLTRLCRNETADRIYVNYHGTDLDRFRPELDTDGASRRGPLRIVTCGSLEEYKGFHYLLEAVAVLRNRGHDVSCEMAGDGPQRAYLESRARELGIGDRVIFHGFIDQAELARVYAAANVFAMPSITLGRYGKQDVIPNVIAEAMASGVAVVATDIAGIPELIEDGVTGLLVPQRDAVRMADALETLIQEPGRADVLAKAGREKIARIWDRSTNIDALAEIINSFVTAGVVADAEASA